MEPSQVFLAIGSSFVEKIRLMRKRVVVRQQDYLLELLYGNEQYFVMEILIRLLGMASLQYRISPLFKSINLVMNMNDHLFKYE